MSVIIQQMKNSHAIQFIKMCEEAQELQDHINSYSNKLFWNGIRCTVKGVLNEIWIYSGKIGTNYENVLLLQKGISKQIPKDDFTPIWTPIEQLADLCIFAKENWLKHHGHPLERKLKIDRQEIREFFHSEVETEYFNTGKNWIEYFNGNVQAGWLAYFMMHYGKKWDGEKWVEV